MPDKKFKPHGYEESFYRFLNNGLDPIDKFNYRIVTPVKNNLQVASLNDTLKSNSSYEESMDRAYQNQKIKEATERAKERLEKEKVASVATSPYDITKGWRESTEDAARLDKYTLEELGYSPEEAQKAYDENWKNARNTLGTATGLVVGTPLLFGASSGALGLPVADVTNALFAADAIKNLASNNGVAKTVRLAKSGDTWGAIKSGAWDALDLSMLGHTAGTASRVGKSILNGSTFGNAYRSDVAGRLFDKSVRAGHNPVVTRIGDVEINPDTYYRQGNGLIKDLQTTGTVRAESAPAKESDKIGNISLRKGFGTPMFAQGKLWYEPGAYSDLLVTKEGMNLANKESTVTNSLHRAGVRRISHPDFHLTPENVSTYRWDPNYGYRYVSGPRSWQSAEHTVKFTPSTPDYTQIATTYHFDPRVKVGSRPISEAELVGMPKSTRNNYGLTDEQRKQVIDDANDFAKKYGYAEINDSPEALQQIQDMYRRHNTFGRTIADPDEFNPIWHHFGEEHRGLTTQQRAEIAATEGYPYAFGMLNPQDRVFVSGNPSLLENYGASTQPTFAVRRRIVLGHNPLKWRQNSEFELGNWAREMKPNEIRQSGGMNAQSNEVMLGTGELSAKPLTSPAQLSGAFNTPVIKVSPNWLQMQGFKKKYLHGGILKAQFGLSHLSPSAINQSIDKFKQTKVGKTLNDFFNGTDSNLSDEEYIQKHGYAKPIGGIGILGAVVAPEWEGVEGPIVAENFGYNGIKGPKSMRILNPKAESEVKQKSLSNWEKFLQKPIKQQDLDVKYWNAEKFSSMAELKQNPTEFKKFKKWVNNLKIE